MNTLRAFLFVLYTTAIVQANGQPVTPIIVDIPYQNPTSVKMNGMVKSIPEAEQFLQDTSSKFGRFDPIVIRLESNEDIYAAAVHYVQPDVVRLAGVTEFWQVADMAHCHSLPVVPHVGDMCQVHQHLCLAHPACALLEYIPWLRDWMESPAQIEGGYYIAPEVPGAGMTPSRKALSEINKV